MPYIDKKTQEQLQRRHPSHSGELNYEITKLVTEYVLTMGLCYQTCNDIVGALDNAKHEFRRRIQDRYEDIKIEANGDVYQACTESLNQVARLNRRWLT